MKIIDFIFVLRLSQLILIIFFVFGINYAIAQQQTSSAIKPEIELPFSIRGNKITITQSPYKATIEIPWNDIVGAAVFTKGNKLWVVFNSYRKFEYDNISLPKKESSITEKTFWLESVQQLDLDDSNAFIVFDLATIYFKEPIISVDKNDYNWIIEVSDNSLATNKEISVITKPFASPFPRVEVDVGENVDLINYSDPFVGDKMQVLPLMESKKSITKSYKFVEFDLLKTAQGVAVQIFSDVISSEMQQGKLLIGSSGITLSSKVLSKKSIHNEYRSTAFKIARFVSDEDSILNLRTFRVAKEDFNYELYRIYQELQEVKDEERGKIYGNLALFYLANDFYKEAKSVIKVVQDIDPDFAYSYEIKLVAAAAEFMDGNYAQAFQHIKSVDTSATPINARRELRFWQGIIGYMTNQANDFIISNNVVELFSKMETNFLIEYTQPFISKLAMAIIEEKTEKREFEVAEKILDIMLHDKDMTSRDSNHLYYIAAKYYFAMHNDKLASQYLDKCVEDVVDQLNRTLCRFEKVKYQLANSKILPMNAINELEKLSYIWRGNQLEIDILDYLGQTYHNSKDFANSLRTWKKILNNFPNSSDALLVNEKMSDTFVDFFLLKKDEKMKPRDALAVFYEFKDLTPLGELGDEIIIKFADYLVKLDLLDRATALLNHQVINRITGLKRELIINKLAKLHILNQKPKIALEVLNLGDKNVPQTLEILEERKYIKAQALYLIQEYEAAILLLTDDLSQPADNIKANIYWDLENWEEFNNFSEPYIYQIKHDTEQLSEDDVLKLLKQAISYIIIGRKDLLKDLYVSFKDRLPASGRYTDIAKLLAETWLSKSDKGINGLQDISSLKKILDDLITSVRKR